jgi:hypothetical protein
LGRSLGAIQVAGDDENSQLHPNLGGTAWLPYA